MPSIEIRGFGFSWKLISYFPFLKQLDRVKFHTMFARKGKGNVKRLERSNV